MQTSFEIAFTKDVWFLKLGRLVVQLELKRRPAPEAALASAPQPCGAPEGQPLSLPPPAPSVPCRPLAVAAKLFAHVGAEQRRILVNWLSFCGPEAAIKGNFMQPVQTVAGKSKRLPLPMLFKCLDLSPPALGLQSQRRGANANAVQVPPLIERGAGGPAP